MVESRIEATTGKRSTRSKGRNALDEGETMPKNVYIVLYRTCYGYTTAWEDWRAYGILPEGETLTSYVFNELEQEGKPKSIDKDAILEFEVEPASTEKDADGNSRRPYPKRKQYTLRALRGTLPT